MLHSRFAHTENLEEAAVKYTFFVSCLPAACTGWRSPHGFCRHMRSSVSEQGVRRKSTNKGLSVISTLEDKGALSMLIIPHLKINEQIAGYRRDGYETSSTAQVPSG